MAVFLFLGKDFIDKMESASALIADAVIQSSPKHRGGTNVQVSEFSGGGVRLTGFKQISASSLCDVAKKLDKLISISASRDGGLAIDVEDVPCDVTPKALLVVGTAITSTSGPAAITTVHPLPTRSTTVALSKFMLDRSAVEVILRPKTLTVISVVPSKIKGGLSECYRNGRHAKRLNGHCGSLKYPQKRKKIKTMNP